MEEVKPDSLTTPNGDASSNGGASSRRGFFGGIFQNERPKLRLTSEYDSETSVFLNKVSCRLLNDLAKLKLSFHNNSKGEVSDPQITFTSKFFSLHYDVEENEALLKASFEIATGLHFRADHSVKDCQGEVAMIADLAGPDYKFQLSSAVPSIGKPKASFIFPLGEVTFEEKDEEEQDQKKALAVSGFVRSHVLNGLCSALYSEDSLNLRYAFKDEQLTFIPSISLPSNVLSCAFKRRFSPFDKLSYLYFFDSNNWSVVYKHTVGKDYKFKTGYDSKPRLGWASLWFGNEDGKAKTAPMKLKVQIMLQVPQDDINSSALMFCLKKRWDI